MRRGWIIGMLGVWLLLQPFFAQYPAFSAWWNTFFVGIVIGGIGLSMINVKHWQGWISVWLSIWLIISSFIPLLHHGNGFYFNNFFCGLIALTAGFGTYLIPRQRGPFRRNTGGYGQPSPSA
jgi:hypothetical protein